MKRLFTWFEQCLKPFPDKEMATPKPSLRALLLLSAQGAGWLIVIMMMLTMLIGSLEALFFAGMGKIVDWLSHTSPENFWHTEKTNLLILTSALLLGVVLVGLKTLIKHQALAGNFPMRLRWHFHRLLLQQSMTFYQDEFSGRIAAKIMQTALAVRDIWFILSDILVFVVIYFATMVLVVAHFDYWIMLPFVMWLLAYTLTLYHIIPHLARSSQQQANARADMTGRITDAYTNISTVKLFSHSGREAHYAQQAMTRFLTTVHQQMRYVSVLEVLNDLFNALLVIGTGAIALYLWTQHRVSIGGVAVSITMALRLNGVSHWIMWEVSTLYEQIGTAQDGLNTLAIPPKINDNPNAQQLIVKQGGIVFRQVTFAYHASKPVLQDFDLEIRHGEKVALVGRSGAGKSTLVNLLLRFYDIQAGEILIDGQDICHVTQHSLRACMSMITQDTSLLHRSIRENILYGRPTASEDDLLMATQQAHAHDFILTLRDNKGRSGYDAHVGERGVKLSGGQRQRIAIARALLKNAPILILDEATSALDSEVEQAIQENLVQLTQHKTVLAIAHRLSTISAMDRLVVIDQGRIVEMGNHTSLLARNGLYANLWHRQSGGFLAQD